MVVSPVQEPSVVVTDSVTSCGPGVLNRTPNAVADVVLAEGEDVAPKFQL